MRSSIRAFRAWAALLVLVGVSCIGGDAPTDPAGAPSTAQLGLVPEIANASGQPLEAAAARQAFDRLTCFELVAVRTSDGEEAARETFEVSAGQEDYDLSVEVDLREIPETFRVTITAYASTGDDPCGFELFSGTREVSVETDGLGESTDSPPSLQLTPSGPQAEASELRLQPGHAVLSGGGTIELVPALLDASGEVIVEGSDLAAVLTWESGADATAAVDEVGRVTGASDGVAEITAATLTDLTAAVPVSVATGEFAYVSGGDLVVTTVDGSGEETVASGASRPAWGPGGVLAYEADGSIEQVDGGTLLTGAGSPTFSPDGAYLTGYAGGLLHATADGSVAAEEAVPGPADPRWVDAATLVGGGGSIVRVRADGTERTELTSGPSDRLPAVGGGRIAFLSDRGDGGTGVWVMGTDGGGMSRVTPESFDAAGRPSVSGPWILVPGSSDRGSGLHLVPVDGGAEPLPLSIAAGTDPAWKTDVADAPPALQITGLEPERPVAGSGITVRGAGFAWVVPEANTVEVPVRELGGSAVAGADGGAIGTVEAEIVEVTETSLTFTAPNDLVAGTGRMATVFSEASFDLEPASGDLRIAVATASGKAVGEVGVEVRDESDQTLASGSTGPDGTLLLEDLPPASFTLALTAPEGFSVESPADPVSVELDRTVELEVDAAALPWSLALSRTSITFDEPNLTERVDYEIADIDGDPVEASLDFDREPASVVQARVRESQIELESLNPGSAVVTVTASLPTSAPPASDDGTATDTAAADAAPAAVSSESPATATIEVEVLAPPEPDVEIILDGDYIVEAPEDLDAFRAEGYTDVDGNLIVRSSPSDALTNLNGLESLEEVTGDLFIVQNGALTDISGLRGLTTVGGDLVVADNSVLPNLDGFGLATLQTVGGGLEIESNPALTDVSGLRGLRSVGAGPCEHPESDSGTCGDLVFHNNGSLGSIVGLSSLTTVGGSLMISGNHALEDLPGLSSVGSIGGALFVTGNPALTSLQGLGGVGGTLTSLIVQSNGSLTSLAGLEGIQSIDGSQSDTGGGMLRISNNANLSSVDGLSGLESANAETPFEIKGNPALTSIDLPALTSSGSLLIQGNDLSAGLALDNLQALGTWLKIESNPELTDVSLPSLRTVPGHLMIRNNESLGTIALPALETAGGFLMIENNDALTTVGSLDSFTEGQKIVVADNEVLGAVPGLPAGLQLEGIDIRFNPSLTDLSGLSAVAGLNSDLDITGNASLSDLSPLTGMGSVGIDVRIVNNPQAGGIGARAVADDPAVSGLITIVGNGHDPFAAVSGGGTHSCALTADGAPFCWGSDASGERGVGGTVRTTTSHPEPVAGGHVFDGVSAAPDDTHTCAVQSDTGEVWCWGSNSDGQLGNGSTGGSSAVPVQVSGSGTTHDFVQVTAGARHTCARTPGGAVWCWGDAGALGAGANADSGTPVQVTDSGSPLAFSRIDAGSAHTCGVADNGSGTSGEVWCWGAGGSGQLGDGNTSNAGTPVLVDGSDTRVYLRVAAGGDHACGIDGDGLAFCWGANASDQLGDGTGAIQSSPVPVQDPAGGAVVYGQITAGAAFTCAIAGAGDAFCWGSDGSGQLGDGGIGGTSAVPVAVSGVTLSRISAGDAHACGIAGDGAWCWGTNASGQLGDGSTATSGTPVKVFNP